MGNVSQLLSLYRYHCNNGPERFIIYKKTHAVLAIKGEKKDEKGWRTEEIKGKQREGKGFKDTQKAKKTEGGRNTGGQRDNEGRKQKRQREKEIKNQRGV
jgi:hypothetical protein